MVFRQVITSRQNISDFLRGNSYIIFFAIIVLLSEAWWAFRIPPSWLYHGGGFALTMAFFVLLLLVDEKFRKYLHWLPVKGADLDEVKEFCKNRGFDTVVVGDTYDGKKVGFVYLEDMMEVKLKC